MVHIRAFRQLAGWDVASYPKPAVELTDGSPACRGRRRCAVSGSPRAVVPTGQHRTAQAGVVGPAVAPRTAASWSDGNAGSTPRGAWTPPLGSVGDGSGAGRSGVAGSSGTSKQSA